jgi:hypothetical protein
MKYPDGTIIRQGDVVWLNEGTQVGKISEIIDDEFKVAKWGLEPGEYGVFICLDLSGNKLTNDIFQAEKQFVDEGIGVLSSSELSMILTM